MPFTTVLQELPAGDPGEVIVDPCTDMHSYACWGWGREESGLSAFSYKSEKPMSHTESLWENPKDRYTTGVREIRDLDPDLVEGVTPGQGF